MDKNKSSNEKEIYRRKIIEMVGKIEKMEFLKMIFGFVRRFFEEESSGR